MKVADAPDPLKPYVGHGMVLSLKGTQAVADCPFCGGSNKFYINPEDGLWQCKTCQTGTAKGGGNIYTFLRQLWNVSTDATTSKDHKEFAADRSLLYSETLISWEVCKSILTGEWLIPGYSPDGKMNNLYRYGRLKEKDKWVNRWLSTVGCRHHLHGINLFNPSKQSVLILEGPGDAMALWETLVHTKQSDNSVMVTGAEASSFLKDTNIIAVPGASTWYDDWAPMLSGKDVIIMYDSDHPKEVNGKLTAPAGFEGVKKIATALAHTDEHPNTIKYLHWGDDGYDPDLPTGTDIRDVLKDHPTAIERGQAYLQVLEACLPIPQDWVPGRTQAAVASGGTDIELLPCTSWKDLIIVWRKAMKWTEGLDRALSVMLSAVISTKAVGDQSWFKIIGPASCGKSTLCEAISANKKYVLAKSTIRGFHSGFKTDREGKEDNSLLAVVNGKTLVTKDGDTLLQSPNLGQILSEARDVYDRTSRTHYRHGLKRDYEGISMTWLLCGTSSLRSIDSSELGERFLDCVIMESIDPDLEDDILWRVANRVSRGMSLESGTGATDQNDSEMTRAIQMTGGFINHLRLNSQELLSSVVVEESDMRTIIELGKFVAYMRARPSTKQQEHAEREFAARLVSQLVRLATCLAGVFGVTTLSQEIMRRVRQVALDTARGRTFEIIKVLQDTGREGMPSAALSHITGHAPAEERTLLRFLKKIGALESFIPTSKGVRGQARWRLTTRMAAIYTSVIQDVGNVGSVS